jgi:subtilisin family serine protease
MARSLRSLPALLTLSFLLALPAQASSPNWKVLQWNMKAIHLQEAWQIATAKGAGVKVCTVDSGIALNHPDFAGAIVGGINTVDITTPNAFADDDSHGTHVAGIIAARGAEVDGVAPRAELLIAKVVNKDGDSSSSAVTAGIAWCIAQGARVINISLGGAAENYDGMASMVTYGCKLDVDFAVAAGNGGSSDKQNPASIHSPCLIAVNASNPKGQITPWSNFDQNPRTVTAPGLNILSDSPDGYVQMDSGTSMSAPHVAGTLALLRGMGADARQAVNAILASAQKPPHTGRLSTGDIREFYGYGLLDAAAACVLERQFQSSASIAAQAAHARASLSNLRSWSTP